MRKLDIRIEIDAPPEAVWKAVTEGEEITKWFAPVARVTPGLGGTVFLSFGPGMEGEAPIRIWDPGKRFGWVEREGTDNPRTMEFIIEGSGGKTTLRLVHSGFGDDASFDAEYDSTHGGWNTFLAMLKAGMERFPNAPAENVTELRMAKVTPGEAWTKLTAPDGLALTATSLRLGAETVPVQLVRDIKPGYRCLASPTAIIGLFSENGGPGNAIVTVEWIEYRPAPGRGAELRRELAGLMDRLFA